MSITLLNTRLLSTSFRFLTIRVRVNNVFTLIVRVMNRCKNVTPFSNSIMDIRNLVRRGRIKVYRNVFNN